MRKEDACGNPWLSSKSKFLIQITRKTRAFRVKACHLCIQEQSLQEAMGMKVNRQVCGLPVAGISLLQHGLGISARKFLNWRVSSNRLNVE